MAAPRVAFVCIGNVCRSPLAALVLARMADEAGVSIEVSSFGLSARADDLMDPDSLACAARHGLDGSAHRARRLIAANLDTFDLLVVLDGWAVGILQAIARMSRANVEVVAAPVVNPWRRGQDVHEQAYQDIVSICEDVLAACLLPDQHA